MDDFLGHSDLESFEAISQDDFTRRLFLRMAALSREGRLDGMIDNLQDDDGLDPNTRDAMAEIAADPTFLHAVHDYLRRTHVVH